MTPKRVRRPVEQGDPEMTVAPPAEEVAATATVPPASEAPIDGAQLDAAILRAVRQRPNRTVDLQPLADELGLDPARVQLAIESLHRRRMVIAPFIEPSSAGGATLTSVGNRWLIQHEGGSPADTPVALKPATQRVRPEDEAARLPRSQVYGISRS
ncbi:MAG: hypothetical protein KY392_04970 [Chloroflexi bacterium]|nr:hypothetical protein [Chloroflexota bacterium]